MVINKNNSNANFLTLSVCLILSLIISSLQPLPFPTQKIKSSLVFYKNNKKFCTIIMIFVGGIPFSSSSSFFSHALFTVSFSFLFLLFFLNTFSILSISLFACNFLNTHLLNCWTLTPTTIFFFALLNLFGDKKWWERKRKQMIV